MTSTKTTPDGVLLLHGIARRATSLGRMERAFGAAGYRTLNIDYPARTAAIQDLIEGIVPSVSAFGREVAQLHIVTHSMGGLLARGLIARHRPGRLGRVVMLGPPNLGSEIADRLGGLWAYRRFFGPAGAQLVTRQDETLLALLGQVDYPLGIIAGDRSLTPLESWLKLLPKPHDRRVAVARTRLGGMTDHVTLPATHALMMNHRLVIDEALHFVRFGRFARGTQSSR